MGEATEQFGTTFRRAVLAVLFVAAGSAAWAGGAKESNEANKTNLVKGIVTQNGVTEIHLTLGRVDSVVLKKTMLDRNTTTYSMPLEGQEKELSSDVAEGFASSAAGTVSLSTLGLTENWTAQEQREGPKPSSIPRQLEPKSSTDAIIRIEAYGERTRYELSWVGKGKLRRIILEGVPEFVKGEHALFSLPAYSGIGYKRKALSLLASLFPEGSLESTLKTLITSGDPIYPLTVFNVATMDDATKEKYEAAKGALKGAIGKQFLKTDRPKETDDELQFPIVDLSQKGFEQLYGRNSGATARNPYLLGYLGYCYAKNKPVLSYPAKVKLNQKDQPITYDWAKYKEVSASEGTELAKAAMRYLVGAVEYTKYTKDDDSNDERPTDKQTNGSERDVYAANKSRITDWLNGGGGTRSNNYLAGGFSANTANSSEKIGPLWVLTDLETPYKDASGNAKYGTPLPYVPYGIDTPRSFAYKMVEQLNAREWGRNVFQAGNIADTPETLTSTNAPKSLRYYYTDYFRVYQSKMRKFLQVSAMMEYGEPPEVIRSAGTEGPYLKTSAVKPFLPGAYTPSRKEDSITATSYYGPDTTAGIDSVGLLVGAMSMVPSLDAVADGKNRSVGKIVNAYSRLAAEAKTVSYRVDNEDTQTLKGLDAEGKPSYYTKEDGSRRESLGAALTWSDLERMTTLVPDVSLVRKGDLIAGRDANGRPHVGIVVATNWTAQPVFGTDPATLLTKIYVVSVRRGLQVANLGTWGNSGTSFGGFTQNPEGYQIRRLVKYDSSLSASTKDKEDWEAMDPSAESATWTITSWEGGGTKPSTPEASWPWIPNTGEALYLKITGSGKTIYEDIDTEAFAGKKISLVAPKDYGAETTDDGSNIKNNKGTGIEFGYVKKINKADVLVKLATFPRGGTPQYEAEYSSASNRLTTKKDSDGSLVFRKMKSNGTLDSEYETFYVRPNGTSVRPGDDWELQFSVEDNEGIENILKGAKRLAIYDKKLLWRANLYIKENGIDWNDQHPWNAPPAPGVAPVGGNPSWWNESWGYNEWNRKHDGATSFTGLSALLPGNGKQTVTITGFAPLRAESPNGNVVPINGRVAYSYPMNPFEPPFDDGTAVTRYVRFTGANYADPTTWMANRGDAGSMDSPFDFNSKLLYQKALRGTNATVVPTSGFWWNYSQATENGVTVGSATDKNAAMPQSATSLTGNGSIASRAFIPSLGLWYRYPSYGNNVTAVAEGQNLEQLKTDRRGSWVYEAGTDCIGFAQRAASYNGNKYSWYDLPKGITEVGNPEYSGSSNFQDVLSSYGSDQHYRRYPRYTAQSDILSDLIVSHPINGRFANLDPALLQHITPGDVLYWDIEDSKHVALVQNVVSDSAGFVESINLIEASFDGYITQSVAKNNTLKTETQLVQEKYYNRPYHLVRLRSRSE